MIDAPDRTIGEHGGGVGDPPLHRVVLVPVAIDPVDKPDHHRRPLGRLGELAQRLEVLVDERAAQQQILRRVTGDGKLGEKQHVGLGRFGSLHRFQDDPYVAVDVPDDDVHLGPGYPQERHAGRLPRHGYGSAPEVCPSDGCRAPGSTFRRCCDGVDCWAGKEGLWPSSTSCLC